MSISKILENKANYLKKHNIDAQKSIFCIYKAFFFNFKYARKQARKDNLFKYIYVWMAICFNIQ